MFDSIIFRNQRKLHGGGPIDSEALFESMLFYQSVTIIADRAILKQLITQLGHDVLLELVQEGFLKIEYLGSLPVIHTQNPGSPDAIHSPVFMSSPVLDLNNVAIEIFRESTGKQGKGRRLGNRFIANVTEANFGNNLINDLADDLADSNYVENSVKCILKNYTPEYPGLENLEFRISKTDRGVVTDTNIDFEALNQIYHLRIPPEHSSLSPAYLLSHMFNTRSDIYFASSHNSEIATDPVSSSVMNIKYAELLEKRDASLGNINIFRNFVEVDTRAVGAAVRQGSRSPEEFLDLLIKARKMQSWLGSIEPNADLIKEYHEAVVSESWAEKLPAKTTRWVLFSGIAAALDFAGGGGLFTAANLSISAADALLLDRFIGGWKPDHFISDLGEFTKLDDGNESNKLAV